ncbi:MAG: hypothetical protein JSS53_02525, partial [Proteobacteria bacterium]|nr:hypothetical protein [Pseudomonadota bacterium]
MSYCANKLSQLSQKKQALIDEEMRLIEKRKKEIGHLAERLNLLTTSDELLSGLFLELQSALKEKSEHIQHWE